MAQDQVVFSKMAAAFYAALDKNPSHGPATAAVLKHKAAGHGAIFRPRLTIKNKIKAESAVERNVA